MYTTASRPSCVKREKICNFLADKSQRTAFSSPVSLHGGDIVAAFIDSIAGTTLYMASYKSVQMYCEDLSNESNVLLANFSLYPPPL